MVDLWLKDKIAPSPEQIKTLSDWDMWGHGKLAMYPIGPWAIGPFQDTEFDWDAVVHPGGTQKSTFLFANTYAIVEGTQYPEEAWELLKFLTGEEGSKIRQAGGYEIAANVEASKLFQDPDKKPANDQAFLDAVQYAKALPATEKWPEINDTVSKWLEYAERGEMTAEEAMGKACQEVDALLAE
jgi:multiple sugar transport system substrate-binding protein